jgi:hypothetical protein
MDKQYGLLWEVSFWEFLFVTVMLAGGAAYVTGRAVAKSWLGNIYVIYYIVLLAAATRFIHFALFRGTLLSPYYYVIDLVVLLAIAFAGLRITRARQMARQYGFSFERSGLFGWKPRGQET